MKVAPLMKRRTVNVPAVECTIRVIVGTGMALSALALVSVGVTFQSVVGGLLLAGVGLYLVITGLIGYCPIYSKLGYGPLR